MDDKTPGKRICIIRNAESKTNASMIRMMDALLESGHSCSLERAPATPTKTASRKKPIYTKTQPYPMRKLP